MSASRSSDLSPAIAEDPTRKPASAVGPLGGAPDRATRSAALLDHFANPPAEMTAMDAAWDEALALYGDEDSDAWIAALENGTHPLCRVQLSHRAV